MKTYTDPAVPAFLGPDERWRLLGAAVLKQAVIDWKDAVRKQKNPKTDNFETEQQLKSAESFLKSPLCELYSNYDGRVLLSKMKRGLL